MAEENAAHIMTDLKLAIERKGIGGLFRDIFLHAGNQAIAMYRIYRWLYLKGHKNLAFLGFRLNFFFNGVEMHPAADIGPDFHLDHPIAVIVGRRTRIGTGVRLYAQAGVGGVGKDEDNPFLDIRDHVQVYHGAVVAGNCVIGEYAQIGLNAVVLNQDIPPYAAVVGNPARVVKIGFERVDPKDYRDYKYNPDDYHGPIEEEEVRRSGSWKHE